jgi:Predicted nucleic acid-binding protein, contains PIN domain
VTLVDTNLLVYATFADAPEHVRVRGWLQARLAEGEGTVVLCWPVVYAFVRLITSARVFGQHAVRVREGWAVAAAYLEQPAVRLVAPGAGHMSIATELAGTPGLRSTMFPTLRSPRWRSSMGSFSPRTTTDSAGSLTCASSTRSGDRAAAGQQALPRSERVRSAHPSEHELVQGLAGQRGLLLQAPVHVVWNASDRDV